MAALSRRTLLPLLVAGVALAMLPRRGAAGDRQTVVEMVEAAARALAQYGFPQALTRSPPETWSRPGAGLYIFLMDRQDTLLLHPDKRVEGHNVAGAVDPDGRPFIQEILAACSAHPEGAWTSYVWPSATTGELGTKHTYSKAAGDVIVSAGYVALDV